MDLIYINMLNPKYIWNEIRNVVVMYVKKPYDLYNVYIEFILFPWEKLNRELCFHFMSSNKSISHSHYSKTINLIPYKL